MTPERWQRYLWTLLPRPYKVFDAGEKREPTEIEKWAGVLADESARLQNTLLAIRDSWLLTTMQGSLLDTAGYERGRMTRWDDEPDEEYRLRLMAAFDWYALGGTEPGLRSVLGVLGYTDFDLTQRVTEERWAEFAVRVRLGGKTFSEAQMFRLHRVINEIKAAHTILEKLTIEISRTCAEELYFGVAVCKSGEKRLGLPALPPKTAQAFAGVGVVRGGQKQINLHHRTRIGERLHTGAFAVKSGTKTIGPSEADTRRLAQL